MEPTPFNDEMYIKYSQSIPLSGSERSVMRQALQSAPRWAAAAAGALLADPGSSEDDRKAARERLSGLCRLYVDITRRELGHALLKIPRDELRSKEVRLFAYSFMDSNTTDERSFGLVVLTRLAAIADERAMELMRRTSASDPDQGIRDQAAHWLSELEAKGGKEATS
jgi:hypothetical protein